MLNWLFQKHASNCNNEAIITPCFTMAQSPMLVMVMSRFYTSGVLDLITEIKQVWIWIGA